jgi:hypothetical protein
VSDLVAFLRARLDEDISGNDVGMVGRTRKDWNARWVAEVTAKRRIVELHKSTAGMNTYGARVVACDSCGASDEYPVRFPCPTLRLLALPYADHPDYREEWKP